MLAFAQLTWRESLRDIEACLTADQNKPGRLRISVISTSRLSGHPAAEE
jgi:hypothetical protein